MNPLVEEAAFTAHKLAILQAHPLGTLEVEYPLAGNPYGDTMRRRLNGLNAETGIATLSNETTIWCAHCQPILRPFSSLCTPLEDGTGRVPAEILADVVKQSSRYMEIFLRGGAVIKQRLNEGEGNPDRVEIWGDNTATAVFTIFSDMTFYTALQIDYAAICDTLRRLHFALPVNGKPMIQGVDYLPK